MKPPRIGIHRIASIIIILAAGVPAAALAQAAPERPGGPPADGPAEHVVPEKPRMKYLLHGPDPALVEHPPERGFGLLVVLPGGDGGADFQGFVGSIRKMSLGKEWIAAQCISVKWTEKQTAIWPCAKVPVPKMEFTTEEFVEAVIRDVRGRHPVDPDRIFLLAWSSGGPAAYSLSLQPKKSVTGFYIAMAVFRREWLPDLKEARGEAYFLDQSPQDEVTSFEHAEKAKATLEKLGAKVHLESYEGGHGWHGDRFGRLRKGFDWLEKNHAPPPKLEKKKGRRAR